MPTARICLDCNVLFPDDRTIRTFGRCPACRRAYVKRQAARPRKHTRRATPARAAAQGFYSSTAWKKARNLARKRDGVCTSCGTSADLTVHHVLARKTHPELELHVDNLTTMCRSCHGALENATRKR
ncbi:unannotated protein [freshwater metagenome]|uniref:Unannotated protein n=1 Tax=freshwater metagenome TaxID=449393 RepID=A0A6J7I1H5_9ZZZZ|nr:hypothetical protein [Actinomycetota bacterium]